MTKDRQHQSNGTTGAACQRSHAGFTLVELLVVLALSSVIMLALVAALRSVSRTEERTDVWLNRLDQRRVLFDVLPELLSRVSARRAETLGQNGRPVVLFDGRPDAVAWVGVMPAREGAGGRYFFRLALEPGQQHALDSAQALVLRYQPFRFAGAMPDWAGADARVLVADARQLTLTYEDGRLRPAQWLGAWAVPDRLPDSVRLQVTTARDDVPALFVPLRVLPWGAASGGGVATFGGGATE